MNDIKVIEAYVFNEVIYTDRKKAEIAKTRLFLIRCLEKINTTHRDHKLSKEWYKYPDLEVDRRYYDWLTSIKYILDIISTNDLKELFDSMSLLHEEMHK